jgi:hypothetical protein
LIAAEDWTDSVSQTAAEWVRILENPLARLVLRFSRAETQTFIKGCRTLDKSYRNPCLEVCGAGGAKTVIHINWNPLPHLGAIPVKWYGLTFLLGFLIAARLDYGTPTALPWGVVYTNPNSYAPVDGVARHPDQFYELAGDLIIAAFLMRLRGKRGPGVLFLLYLVAFATLRFFVFFVRGNASVVAFGLKNAQLTALEF